MPIKYSDSPFNISYDFLEAIPPEGVVVRNPKFASLSKVNLAALSLYGLDRKSAYESYKDKADLAKDIKTRKKEFEERDGLK